MYRMLFFAAVSHHLLLICRTPKPARPADSRHVAFNTECKPTNQSVDLTADVLVTILLQQQERTRVFFLILTDADERLQYPFRKTYA